RRALELAREHPTPFEFAMLQGVRDPLKREMVEQGHRVSEYIPYGPNWLPYFSRRLRERPRNIMTMIRSFVEDWSTFFCPRTLRAHGPSGVPPHHADPRRPLSSEGLDGGDDTFRGPRLDHPLAEHDRGE